MKVTVTRDSENTTLTIPNRVYDAVLAKESGQLHFSRKREHIESRRELDNGYPYFISAMLDGTLDTEEDQRDDCGESCFVNTHQDVINIIEQANLRYKEANPQPNEVNQ